MQLGVLGDFISPTVGLEHSAFAFFKFLEMMMGALCISKNVGGQNILPLKSRRQFLSAFTIILWP